MPETEFQVKIPVHSSEKDEGEVMGPAEIIVRNAGTVVL
jgi:hypothetical protein